MALITRLIAAFALVVGFGVIARAEESKDAAPAAHAEKEHAESSHDSHASHGHDEPGHPAADSMVYKPDEIKSDLALWTLIVFFLLLAILWKFAWGPIAAGLEKREQMIHEHIAAVERSHEEAKAMLAEHERKLAGTAQEVKALLDEAHRDADHTKQTIIAEAKSAAEAERNRALRDVEAATDAALKSIAEQSANLAVELAGKIVGQKLSSADHSRLIADAVGKFPQSSPSRN
jgi:F-type H+-transporting ATPase subunit b